MYDMVGVWFSLAVVALCVVANIILGQTEFDPYEYEEDDFHE